MNHHKKRGQIWVETAIYTLIALTIIGIILAIATPQIEKSKERSIIGQTEDALNLLNSEILKVEQTAGSVKIVNIRLTKGRLDFDSEDNKIIFTLENSKLEFSEDGTEITEGDITYKTNKVGKNFDISLNLNYDTLDLTFDGENKLKTLHAAGTPYKLRLENIGDNSISNPVHIDIKLV